MVGRRSQGRKAQLTSRCSRPAQPAADRQAVSRMEVHMPTITVRRDKGWADKMRKYRILVDGAEIGQLGEGEVLRHEISDETHSIEARIDWCGSRRIPFQAQSEDLVFLVRSALRGWRLQFTLFYIVFNRRGYLILDQQQ